MDRDREEVTRIIDGAPTPLRPFVADRMLRAPLAAAAFLVGAIALVNPALADECSDAAEMMRTARATVSSAHLGRIDAAVDRAVLRLDVGDDRGCLAELAAIGESLRA